MDIKPPKKRRFKSAPPQTPYKSIGRPAQRPRQYSAPINKQNFRSRAGNAFERIKPVVEIPKIKTAISSNSPDFKELLLTNKLLIFYTTLIFMAAFFLYVFRLSSLPKSTSLDSVTALNVQSFTDLSANVVFGPQKFLDYLLLKLNLASALGLRLSSVLFSIVALVMFFIIIKRWLSVKIAVLATLIFAASTWTITQTRDAGFMNSFFLAVPLLLIAGSYIKRSNQSLLIFPLSFLLAIITYLPGAIWFLLFGLAIFFNNIKNLVLDNDLKKNSLLGAVYFLPIIPLIFFLAKNPASFKIWLGLPAEFQIELTTSISNITALPSQLFVSGVESPLIWLYGSPIIDAATGIFALAGLVFVITDKLHPVRRISLLGLLIMSLLLIFLAGSVYVSLFLPLFYIFAAFGIYNLLEQWFSTFPRNPVARSIGYFMISLLVLGISFYHTSRYFIVWPRNDRVIKSFEAVSSDTINTRPSSVFNLIEEKK